MGLQIGRFSLDSGFGFGFEPHFAEIIVSSASQAGYKGLEICIDSRKYFLEIVPLFNCCVQVNLRVCRFINRNPNQTGILSEKLHYYLLCSNCVLESFQLGGFE